jgi:hypothetical protein
MRRVTTRRVRVMRRFFVVSRFVVLGCLTVMASGLAMVFRSFLMVLSCFFRHNRLPDALDENDGPGRYNARTRQRCNAGLREKLRQRTQRDETY